MGLKEKLGGATAILTILLVLVGILFFAVFGIKGCAPQSGGISRWTGKPVELPAPADCVRVIGFTKTGNTKIISYLNKDGEILMREYSDWGALEAIYKIEGEYDSELKRKIPKAGHAGGRPK